MSSSSVDIYADETFHEDQNILGICTLFVPRNRREMLLKKIMNSRCLFSRCSEWNPVYERCPYAGECRAEWHKNNNAEIHYKKIDSGSSHSVRSISESWSSIFAENKDSFMFNILYLDMSKMDLRRFGKNQSNVYNKFFRSTIKYGIKTFFSDISRVEVGHVYHDISPALSRHGFFPSYNLAKLENELSQVSVADDSVIFIESDHKLNPDSESEQNANLIQFADFILGSVGQNIFDFSKDSFRRELAMKIRPALEEILRPRYSRLKKKYHVSCFPKLELNKKILQDLEGNPFLGAPKDEFYSPKLKMVRYYPNVQRLDTWF